MVCVYFSSTVIQLIMSHQSHNVGNVDNNL